MDPNVAYSNQQLPMTPNQVACMRGVPYNKAIGGVLWPAVVLRPDIGYAIGILLQFIQNPGQTHWALGSIKMGHFISKYNKRPMAYLWWGIKASC